MLISTDASFTDPKRSFPLIVRRSPWLERQQISPSGAGGSRFLEDDVSQFAQARTIRGQMHLYLPRATTNCCGRHALLITLEP